MILCYSFIKIGGSIMSKKKYVKRNKGFTFVELLATITILGLLVMIPVVSYSKFLAKAHLKYYKSQEETICDISPNGWCRNGKTHECT